MIHFKKYKNCNGGRTGLMARASDSRSGDPGSILGRVGVFVSLSKRHLLPKKVLVIPRNRWLRLNMTEKLFTGTLNHNQNKKQKTKTVMQTYMYLLLSHLLMAQDKFCNSLVYVINVKNVTKR